jgi:hypothetical protein
MDDATRDALARIADDLATTSGIVHDLFRFARDGIMPPLEGLNYVAGVLTGYSQALHEISKEGK